MKSLYNDAKAECLAPGHWNINDDTPSLKYRNSHPALRGLEAIEVKYTQTETVTPFDIYKLIQKVSEEMRLGTSMVITGDSIVSADVVRGNQVDNPIVKALGLDEEQKEKISDGYLSRTRIAREKILIRGHTSLTDAILYGFAKMTDPNRMSNWEKLMVTRINVDLSLFQMGNFTVPNPDYHEPLDNSEDESRIIWEGHREVFR